MRILSFILLIFITSLQLKSAEIPLYIQPDTTLEPVKILTSDTNPPPNAKPVHDEALRNAGWMWVETSASLTGYVANEYLNGGTFLPAAPVRVAPKSNAHVFTFISSNDKTTVLERNEWIKISIEKNVALYFKKDTLAQQAEPQALPQIVGQIGVYENPSAIKPTVSLSPSTAKISQPIVTNLTNTANVEQSPPPSAIVAPREVRLDQHRVKTLPIATVPSGVLPQYYEGFLEETRETLFTKPPSQFVLKNAHGFDIAYIDTQRMMVFGNLKDMLGKRVVIQGKSQATADGKNLPVLLHATSIRLH